MIIRSLLTLLLRNISFICQWRKNRKENLIDEEGMIIKAFGKVNAEENLAQMLVEL